MHVAQSAAAREPPGAVGFTAFDLPTRVGRLRVHRAGDGPSLVLLHGIGGGAGSFYWTRLAPHLTTRYTVWAPDLVGWGDSAHPARFLLFDDYVTQIGELLDHVGPARAVVGQGLSAGFAIAAVATRPVERVERLALFAPTGGRDFGEDAFAPVVALTLGLLARVPRVNLALYHAYFHRRGAYRFWFERRGFLDPASVPDDLVEASFRSGTRPNAAYAALPFVAGSLRFDIAPLLRRVDRPGLMLWGSDESQIAPAVRERLEAVNRARIAVHTIPRTRSNFESEAPAATAAALLSFLDASS